MNDNTNAWDISDEMFDRLADGELRPDERRALLASLDDCPGGWRRCALAFLEAQGWGQEFCRVQEGRIQEGAGEPVSHQPSARPRHASGFHWPVALGMAVCFLAVFVLGWGASDWSALLGGRGAPIAESSVDGGLAAPGAAQIADGDDAQPHSVAADDSGDDQRPTYLTLAIGEGPDAEVIDLPVYDLDEVGPQWLAQQAQPLPAELLQTLQRSGHEVRRQQRLMPIGLENGASVVVPVERIQITPVSRQAYQ